MRITLFLCFVCIGQVFGHKGMLREKEALDAAHRRGEAYTLKPGCFFVDPVIEERNDRYRSGSGLRTRSFNSFFGVQNTVEETQNHGRRRSDSVRRNTRLSTLNTSTPVRRETLTLNASAVIERQLEAWSRERMPADFECNAENALKRAVRKVYAERRLVQFPEDGLYVDINAILQDPHLDLWRNCFENVVADRALDRTLRGLFDGLQRQYISPDMIVTTHYERIPGLLGFQGRTDHCFALFRDFLMTSGAYRSARESIAKPLIYLLRKVSALQEDDALKVRFVDLVKDAMTACQDRVLTAVEELCSIAVSAALDDNQLNYEDSDRERAQMSVILSLQKRRLIQAMPSLQNECEGIEYALNAVRLANRVFSMGNRVTEQHFFRGRYGHISPKELAEAICVADVNQLADLLLSHAVWDSLMNQKPSCSSLQEQYCEIDPGDLGGADAVALSDQIKEAKRRETIIALGTHGYLTADRNYPVSPIL